MEPAAVVEPGPLATSTKEAYVSPKASSSRRARPTIGAPAAAPRRERTDMRKLIGLAALLVAAAAVAAVGVGAEGSARHPGPTARASQELPPLKRQGSAEAVVAEHLAALNACDWNRLMAQYPPDVHFFLPGGVVVV